MSRKNSRAECEVRSAELGSHVVGTAVEDDSFYAAWMRLACAQVDQVGETPHLAPRTPLSLHTPEERKKLHPSVVSRLRLAQRFSRRELKDVPHA